MEYILLHVGNSIDYCKPDLQFENFCCTLFVVCYSFHCEMFPQNWWRHEFKLHLVIVLLNQIPTGLSRRLSTTTRRISTATRRPTTATRGLWCAWWLRCAKFWSASWCRLWTKCDRLSTIDTRHFARHPENVWCRWYGSFW